MRSRYFGAMDKKLEVVEIAGSEFKHRQLTESLSFEHVASLLCSGRATGIRNCKSLRHIVSGAAITHRVG